MVENVVVERRGESFLNDGRGLLQERSVASRGESRVILRDFCEIADRQNVF